VGLLFHVGVVARAGHQFAVADHIQAGVAAMDPVQLAAFDHRRHQRGARRVQHAFLGGIANDLVVRGHQRARQELGNLTHRGCRRLLEIGRHGLQGQLGGHRAFRMAPHAVGQHEQPRLTGIGITHAVFVALATALAADLIDRKFHRNLVPASVDLRRGFLSVTRLSNCRRIFSATVSLV